MRKGKQILAAGLALLLMILVTASGVSAQTVEITPNAESVTPADVAVDVQQDVDDTTSQIPEWTTSVSQVLQTAMLTANPVNSEWLRIPNAEISRSEQTESTASPLADWITSSPRKRTIFVSLPDFQQDTLVLAPFLVYPDLQNNLVIWCILQNQSPEEKVVKGFYSVQFSSSGQVVARGFPSEFSRPIRLSPGTAGTESRAALTQRVPNRCFVRFTFAPGTYDSTIDLGKADTLNGSCEWMLEKAS